MSDERQSRKDEFEALKEGGNADKVSKEISKLEPDSKGLYTLRCVKPKPDITKEEVQTEFGEEGQLADVHFTENFFFVRFATKEAALRAFEEKKDTHELDVPGVSKTWTVKDKDDIASKISKLAADTRGFYSIRIAKPSAEFKEEDVEQKFGQFGDIADTHFTDKFIYIRYLSWKEAASAIKGMNDEYNLDIPNISATWRPQKSHTDKGPQIYIGNIPAKASKEQVAELLEPFFPMEYKFCIVNNRNFAFAYFETLQDCKRVVAALNGKVLWGNTLIVRICRDRSRARYIADDDYQYRKSDGRKGGRGDVPQKYSSRPSQRITELYVSNFKRGVTRMDLEALFSSHGPLAYVEIMPTAIQECCKGFVGVYSAYDAKQLIHRLSQRKWNGLKLNVAYSNRVNKPSPNGVGSRGGAEDVHSSPVDRAHTLANKLDILLEDVIDNCDYCVQIKAVMSDLQQATREIKYQILRGEVNQGMGLIDELLSYVETKSQDQVDRQQHIQDFYRGHSSGSTQMRGLEHHGHGGGGAASMGHMGRGRSGISSAYRGAQKRGGGTSMMQGYGRSQAWNY